MGLSENNTYTEDVHSTVSSSTQTAVFIAVLLLTVYLLNYYITEQLFTVQIDTFGSVDRQKYIWSEPNTGKTSIGSFFF